MINSRIYQNLQQPLTLSSTEQSLKPKEDDDIKLNLEQRVELVKEGKEDPNVVLADLGIKNVQVKPLSNNRQVLTFEVNGKSVSISGNSPEDLSKQASEILDEEINNGSDSGPKKSIAGLLFGLLVTAVIVLFKPDIVVQDEDGHVTTLHYNGNEYESFNNRHKWNGL